MCHMACLLWPKKFTNVTKKLTYNYVPHIMFDVIKVIKVTRTLIYNYVPHDMSNVTDMTSVTKELSYNCAA